MDMNEQRGGHAMISSRIERLASVVIRIGRRRMSTSMAQAIVSLWFVCFFAWPL